ncbi:ATP phosphoribosyltransferase regulatory subunit [Aeribacillus pallidus]|uniref:ATP phosphoribosyltransferase regulatory subunit n=2 Tax=Aeribacillus pallidus TaxID=33936 RepID=A0A161Y0K6_9BACI|nr:ATP phosphoribosyltransferase regulatory subunit [Aeribacillus pallidus]
MFEKPLGMRDTLPGLYVIKESVRKKMMNVIESWGYQFLETPTLEFYETVGVQSAIQEQQLFKLLDRQGHTLVLRPDMTAPIARIAASKLMKESLPLRLAYSANVFRAQQHEGGRPAEFEQIGIELIGDGTISADAEAIALMIYALKNTGLKDFKISIGHIGFINALFGEILGKEERAEKLRRYLYEKNFVGYREHVKRLSLSTIDKERLLRVIDLKGGIEKADEASSLVACDSGKKALEDLKQLLIQLRAYEVDQYIKLELNIVSHMSYYTSVIFELYANGVGLPIGNGGRYDHLLEKFERPAPATGFGIRLDNLLEALGDLKLNKDLYCIIFSRENRQEAFRYANKLRKEGKQVVMQDISGIDQIDRFTGQFTDIYYFLGKPGKVRE